jgi:hypothetical protein
MNQSKLNQSIKSLLLCGTRCLTVSGIATGQMGQNSDLFKNLKTKDSILFKRGFTKFKVEKSTGLMTENLEFYHDKGGVRNSKKAFIIRMKNGLCKPNNPEKVYRFLVDDRLAVCPVYNTGELYGALQNGKQFISPNLSRAF